MRTRANVTLDNDAYRTATAFAAAKGLALGVAISELIRRGEQTQEPPISASPKFVKDKYGVFVVKSTGNIITPEMVKQGSEDDLG